jgi:hypothetical protein
MMMSGGRKDEVTGPRKRKPGGWDAGMSGKLMP